MNKKQKDAMILSSVQSMYDRIVYLKKMNRREDCYALYKEWEQQKNKDNQIIPILTINDLTIIQ